MVEPLLSCKSLGQRHGNGPFLFRNLNLALGTGAVLCVIGPNGRGKTTLLRCLAGVDRPAEGSVVRDNSRGVAYVPQVARGGLAYRVLDMVVMGRAGHLPMLAWPSARDRSIAEAALRRVGAPHLRDRAFQTLSGGEKSLVTIARALAAQSTLLILDEPMAALDVANQQLILALLGGLARDDGVAIIVTTHQPQHALALSSDVLVMDTDAGLIQGPAATILDEALLSRVYRMPIARLPVQRGERHGEAVVPLFHAGA